MKYRQVLSAFYSTPLAILPEKLDEIRAFLHTKAAGDDIPDCRVEAMLRSRADRTQRLISETAVPDFEAAGRYDGAIVRGKTAIVPVFGVLAQRVGIMQAMSGGISTEAIGATLDKLMADKTIRSIVMVYDTPGGSVFGIQELAAKIVGYAKEKKIVGIADSVAASAGYWLISQSREIHITPGGQIGSIGVLAAHVDVSEAEAAAGVKTTIVTSSEHKAEFAPEIPLSDDARAELQSKVDYYHNAFIKAVAKGRSTTEADVNRNFGRGRMVTAQDAIARGMADKVSTLSQVLNRVGEPAGPYSDPQACRDVVNVMATRVSLDD